MQRQKTWPDYVLTDVGTQVALAAADEHGNRDTEKESAMTTAPDFYHRLSQRRAALKRRTTIFERLLWLWR